MFAKFLVARLQAAAVLVLLLSLFARPASALPWDLDMVEQQSLRAGQIARSPAKGSFAVGRDIRPADAESGEGFTNPVAADNASLLRGGRLYNIHCAVCHGSAADGQSPVGPLLDAPNLLREPYPARSDGRIFAVVINGLRAMPRQGYKLSALEIWDLINHLRSLQGKAGGQPPQPAPGAGE